VFAHLRIELPLGQRTLQGPRRRALAEVRFEERRQGQPTGDPLPGMSRPPSSRAPVPARLAQAIASSIGSGLMGTRGSASAMTCGTRARAAAAPTSTA
jgi:hypothetical protein